MEQRQRKFKIFLFLTLVLAFALFIPGALANHIDFMDALWLGDDPENLSLDQGDTAELYVHVPFVPRGNTFTLAISAENDQGSQYLFGPVTRAVPYSRNIPLSTTALAGEYEILVQATNAGGTSTETLQLDVNTAPQITVPASPITVIDGQLVSFTITGNDADKDTLTLDFGMRPPTGAVLLPVTSRAGFIEKTLSWTPTYSQVGRYEIKFKVDHEDASTPAAEAIVTIVVLPHNLAPEVSGFGNGSGGTLGDTNSFQEGETLVAQVLASDEDGDSLSYEVQRRYCVIIFSWPTCRYTASLLDEMHFVPTTGRFTFAPGFDFVEHPDSNRTVRLRFRAFDGEFYSAWREMTSEIRDVNQRPIADTMTLTLSEDQVITLALPAHDNDAEDELTYELGGIMPAHGDLSNFDPATGRITYTPDANYYGLDSFTFVVQDDTGTDSAQSPQGTITFEIGGVNDLPTLNIPDTAVSEDFGTTTFNLRNYVSDVESPATAFAFVVTAQSTPSVVSCAMEAATPSFRLVCTSITNQHGSSTITITATDGNGGTAGDAFILTVNPIDDPITILGQVPLSTPEETPLTITLNDLLVEDPDNEYPTGFTLDVARGSYYTVSGTTLTPALNFNGTLSVPVTLLQGEMVRGTLSLSVSVTPVNDAPVAQDDAVTVTEDNSGVILVLNNDNDVDGTLERTSVHLTNLPARGTATVNADGTVTYTPESNSTISKSFTYTVRDNNGAASNEARVVITIRSENDVPQLTLGTQTVDEDSGIHSYNLRDSASDVEDTPDELSFYISGETRNDIIDCEIAADGFTLVCTTQPDQTGESFVDIRVTDSEGAFRFFPVQFTVTSINDAPLARDDAVTVIEDSAQIITVLTNDSDRDGTLERTSVRLTNSPARGTATVNADGTITYTPELNSTAAESFTYTVEDNESLVSNEARVSITFTSINDTPTLTIPPQTIDEDSGTLSLNLQDYASDAENTDDQLRFVLGTETHPEIVDCTLAADGHTLNCSAQPNQTGESMMTVRVIDSLGALAFSTFTITVMPVNDAPLALDDSAEGIEDTPLTIAVLANDEDIDSALNPSSVHIEENPQYGAAIPNSDGTITYTSNRNSVATDSFTYVVSDVEGLLSNEVTVTITLTEENDAPLAHAQTLETEEDTSLSLILVGEDIDGSIAAFRVTREPLHGTLRGTAPDLSYTPSVNYYGEDSFAFVVEDNESATSEEATVQIVIIPLNDAPLAQDDAAETTEETPITIDALANDSDVDGVELRVTEVSDASFGTVSIIDNALFYTPYENIFGVTDTFTYTIEDPSGEEAQAIVRVTITPLDDDAPQIIGQRELSIEEDTSLTLQLSDLVVEDPDGEFPTDFGLVILAGEHYAYEDTTITPDANWNGRLEVPVQVVSVSGDEQSNTFILEVEVVPVNDRPVIVGQVPLAIEEDERLSLSLDHLIIEDPDRNAALQISFVGEGENYIVKSRNNIRPDDDFSGTLSIPVKVRDEWLESDPFTLTVTVNPVNDAPRPDEDLEISTLEDTPVTFFLSGFDEEGDVFSFVLESSPLSGTITHFDPTTGEVTYLPELDFSGRDTIWFSVQDAEGTVNENPESVDITVIPMNDTPIAEDDFVTTEEDTPVEFNFLENDFDVDGSSYSCLLIPEGAELPDGGSEPEGLALTLVRVNGEEVSFSATPDRSGAALLVQQGSTLEIDAYLEARQEFSDAFVYASLLVTSGCVSEDLEDGTEFFDIAGTPELPTTRRRHLEFDLAPRFESGRYFLKVVVAPDRDSLGFTRYVALEIDERDPELGEEVSFVSINAPGIHGTLSCDSDGDCTYEPNENFTGTDSFTYRITDGLLSDEATVTLSVEASNDQPQIIGQEPIEMQEDSSRALTLSDLQVSDVDSVYPEEFTLELGEGENYTREGTTITPTLNFFGTLQIPVRVSDGSAESDEGFFLQVRVTPVNDRPFFTSAPLLTSVEDQPYRYEVTALDVENSPLTFSAENLPAWLTFYPVTGILQGTPREEDLGMHTLTLQVSDGELLEEQSFTLTVNAVDDSPLAEDAEVTGEEDSPLQITLQGSDPERSTITFSILSQPNHGTLSGLNSATGEVSYIPQLNYFGTDSFVFGVSDGVNSAVATVQIIITPLNDAPVAQDDAISVREEEERIFSVTENDSDPDSTLQVTIASGVGHGTLACNEEGRCTYTPQENFTGADSFTYTLSDGVLSDTATVTLTIEASNDQPQIIGQEPIEMQEDSSRALTLSDLQVNDVDNAYPEEFALEVDNGENYNLEGTTITPTLNFFGTLQIPVRVSDGSDWSERFTLQVRVTPMNDVPTADAQIIPVEEDTPEEITLTGSDVEASPLTFTLVTTPTHGTLSEFNPATREVTYTPQNNFSGEDIFTFTVADETSESLPATVTLVVGAENDAPILTLTPAGDRIIAEGEFLHITATATDVDSINLAFTIEERRGRDLAGATFESGEFNWTPGVLQAGVYELTFRVTDESGLFDEEEISITVQNAPQIPVALEQNLSLDEDTQKEITLSGTDRDGSIVAYTITRFPAHGRLTGTAPHLIYTPAANFHGTDNFTFTVTDNDGLVSVPATVTLTITSINDAPVITSQPLTTALLGEEYAYQVTAQDDDPLNFSFIEAPEGMTMDSTGMISWTPRMTGTFAVEVEVSDGLASARQHYTITVQRGRQDLQLTSIHLNSEELSAGDTLVLSVQAANKGKASEQKVQITVSLPELGIERSVSVGKLKAGRSATKTVSLPLPYDALPGEYLLRVSLHNDSLHETEYRKIYMWG